MMKEECVRTVLILSMWHFAADAGRLEVGPDVYSFSEDNFQFSMFVVTGDGVVVVDSFNEEHAKGLIESIREVTDEPIKYLIHTHNHYDHVGGNHLFREAGATLVAHKEAVDFLEENPRPQFVTPEIEWEGKCKSITLGDTTIQLLFLGINHGHGMTIPYLPKQKMVYVADLVVPSLVTFATAPDFNLAETERTIGDILQLDWDKAVYAHSGLEDGLVGGTKDDAMRTKGYLKELRAVVKQELAKGTNFLEVPNKVELPEYEDFGNYAAWLPLNAYKVVFEELLGPMPWRKIVTKGPNRGESINNCPTLDTGLGGRNRILGPWRPLRSYFQ